MTLQVVIPSKGRAGVIRRGALRLFPDATVVVEEGDHEAYSRVVPPAQLKVHDARGLPMIRNWIWRNIGSEGLVTVDDDVNSVRCLVGWRGRSYIDPEVARQVIENTAQCARDAGCPVFGFNLKGAPMYYRESEPFRLNRGIGAVWGVVADHGIRSEAEIALLEDVSFSLQVLLHHRIIWTDQRWFFSYTAFQSGGQQDLYSQSKREASYQVELAILRERWGKWLIVDESAPSQVGALQVGPKVRVPRTQELR